MSYNPLHIKDNNNAGASFNAHAIRFRAFDSNSNGFIFENSSGTILSSIRARDGLSYFSGNVGIGTTTPESTLDINGDLSLGVGDITAFVPGFDAAISNINATMISAKLGSNTIQDHMVLPPPSQFPGRVYVIRNTEASATLTLRGFRINNTGSIILRGSNTSVSEVDMNANDDSKVIMLISDGTSWIVIN